MFHLPSYSVLAWWITLPGSDALQGAILFACNRSLFDLLFIRISELALGLIILCALNEGAGAVWLEGLTNLCCSVVFLEDAFPGIIGKAKI